ncbi:CidA/LrgA family protein [Vibrio aphrogenes]|uniref:CidA/LrgA family protein n=1 Tax=Vibrio aphrogenes TaxID=1891186 RepID=UPI000B35C174|nr:CidA/LrgA family protein [Vibrio aphrogenes]
MLKRVLVTAFQIVIFSFIWLLADWMVKGLHLPIPANLTGMLLLLMLLFAKVIKGDWLRSGATWLLSEMLLFFVPAVVAVVNYPDLMLHEGLKILAVLFFSTILVIGVTALVVDRVYRLEFRLASRKAINKMQNEAARVN